MPTKSRTAPVQFARTQPRKSKKNKKVVVNVPQAIVNANTEAPGRSVYTQYKQSGANTRTKVPKAVELPQFLVALADPFNVEAFGCKIPDDEMSLSITCFSQGVVTLPADVVFGNTVQLWTPDPLRMFVNSTGSSAVGAWNWPSSISAATPNTIPNLVSLQAQVEAVRVVAGGIKLTCPTTLTSTQGTFHLCYVPLDYNLNAISSLPNNIAQMSQMPGYRTGPLVDLIEDEGYCSFRPTDIAAQRYRDINITWAANAPPVAGLESTPGWYAICVAGVTGQSLVSSPLQTEFIFHYEALLKPGNIFVASKPAMHSPISMAAIGNALSCIDGIWIKKEDNQEVTRWSGIQEIFNQGMQFARGAAPFVQAMSALLL
jgi:hypothetical protein